MLGFATKCLVGQRADHRLTPMVLYIAFSPPIKQSAQSLMSCPLPNGLAHHNPGGGRFSDVRRASPCASMVARRRPALELSVYHYGFVRRYRTHEEGVDGLPPGEGVFLPCSFWLCDCYELLGRRDDAHDLFGRLVDLGNDLGLLSEEYDPKADRLLGNFPQAFTHLALVNTAFNLAPHLPSPMHLRHAQMHPE